MPKMKEKLPTRQRYAHMQTVTQDTHTHVYNTSLQMADGPNSENCIHEHKVCSCVSVVKGRNTAL